MKKKIKIKLNGRSKTINENATLLNIIKNFKVPLKKVAIELNQEIVDKKKIKYINLKQNDKIEIVHFIGGG
jgi:sulfur carrier protein|tara:strand:- start:47 stop:259 length:213 start_codon:yes stop_codon:yes gene_type:complete